MARILFFGPLKEVCGAAQRELSLPRHVQSPQQLIAYITDGQPNLHAALGAASVRVIVNQNIVGRDFKICDDDEIAFLPPFSGG